MSCWGYENNQLKELSGYFNCPGTSNCCANQDICLPNHMCYSFGGASNKVDFYPAGCQNQEFPSPECPKWCSAEVQQAAVTFNSGNNTWTCCGNNALGKQDCSNPSGQTFGGNGPNDPWSESAYTDYINHAKTLGIGIIVAIVIACIVFLGFCATILFCCCCSRRARDRRNRGKFVPLGTGRDIQSDQVVWNSNVHDSNELHEGPMGGYAAQPLAPGSHGAPQYTVQGFR